MGSAFLDPGPSQGHVKTIWAKCSKPAKKNEARCQRCSANHIHAGVKQVKSSWLVDSSTVQYKTPTRAKNLTPIDMFSSSTHNHCSKAASKINRAIKCANYAGKALHYSVEHLVVVTANKKESACDHFEHRAASTPHLGTCTPHIQK